MLKIDVVSVLNGAKTLSAASTDMANVNSASDEIIRSAYSAVSGLGEMGDTHLTILSSNSAESIQAFADRFSNAAITLRQNVSDVVNADEALAASLDAYQRAVTMGTSLGMPGLTNSPLATGPAGSTVNTDTQNLSITPPTVTRPPTLMGLIGQFSGTNHGTPPAMAGDWTSLATQIQTAADSLEHVLGDLESSADTHAIQRAIDTIRTIQTTGYVFSNNARGLAINTSNLGVAGTAQAQQASHVATLYLTALPVDPTLATTIEQSYLTSFPPAMTTTLLPSLPTIAQLLPPMSDPNGTSAGTLGAVGSTNPGANLSTWEDVPLPSVVQDAMDNYGMADAARMRNPQHLAEEFNRTGPEAIEAIMAGHTPTTTASAGAPTMPPTLSPGTQPSTVATPTGGAGVGGVGNAGGAGGLAGLSGPGAPATGSPSGANGRGITAGNIPTGPATTATGTGGAQARGAHGTNTGAGRGWLGRGSTAHGGAGATGSRTSPGLGGLAAGGGLAGTGSMTGVPGGAPFNGVGKTPGGPSGVGGPGGSAMPGSPGGSYGSGMAGASSASTHGNQGTRGAMPMGGMMGAGRGAGQRGATGSSPVRKVTSAVEREGNLKALLGEGPEVIPGVIGAWVREPRTDR